MADINIEEFRRYVEPYATGVTAAERLWATQDVLRDFCTRTKCWQRIFPAVMTVPGTSEYAIDVPVGAIVSQVEEVFVADAKMAFSAMDGLAARTPGQNWLTLGSGYSQAITFIEPGTLRLVPPPDSAKSLYVRAALTLDNTTAILDAYVPDFVFRQWAEKIADGILAKLYYTPDKTYSSANRADAKSLRYEQHVAGVRLKVAQSYGRKGLETTPYFY